MLKKTFTLVIVALAILFSASISASPFDRGRSNIAISAGSGSAFNDDYIILGLGYGYYLTNGLQLGIGFDFWLNGSPSVYQVTPEIQYVFHQVPKVKPYIGAFYTRSYIENYDDLDAVGYRAGLYFVTSGNTYIGIGGAYRKYQDCTESVYTDCSNTYTELSFLFTF
ncbi:MAG: hypothetical protein P8Y28_00995 [Gammaproteobacteria bacterium]|jgi:hypothetical protein